MGPYGPLRFSGSNHVRVGAGAVWDLLSTRATCVRIGYGGGRFCVCRDEMERGGCVGGFCCLLLVPKVGGGWG